MQGPGQQVMYEQPPPTVPFYQFLGQPQQYLFEPNAVPVQAVVSQNPSQLPIQPQNQLITMEPFATQHLAQSASAIHSNLPSHKNSFHTDDSLAASPQQHINPNIQSQNEQLSVFSRQSTAQAKASPSSEGGEGGPIGGIHGIKESDQQNNEEDQLELEDLDLDRIRIPLIQLNISNLQIILINNITQVKKDKEESKNEPCQLKFQSPDEKGNSNNSSFLLNSSISSCNLNNIQSMNSVFSTNPIQNSASQDDKHTLTLGQSIWSPQIPPQTQQEFLQQSQILSQQNQIQFEMSSQQKQPETPSSVQNYIQQTNIQQQQQPSSTTILAQPQLSTQQLTSSPTALYQQPPAHMVNQPVPQNHSQIIHSYLSSQLIPDPVIVNANGPPQMQSQQLMMTGLDQQNLPDAANLSHSIQSQQQIFQQLLNNTAYPPPQQPQNPLVAGIYDSMPLVDNISLQQNQSQMIHQYLNNPGFQPSQSQPNPLVIANMDLQETSPHQLSLLQQSNLNTQIINQLQSAIIPPGMAQAPINSNQQMQLQHHLITSNNQSSMSLTNSVQDLQSNSVQSTDMQQLLPPVQQQHIILQQQQQQQNMMAQANQIKQPTPLYNKTGMPNQQYPNDLMNNHHYDHNAHLSHLYVNRYINRYMLNPIYKSKSHKYGSQGSFRGGTQSPVLLFPGNLSVMRPPPGFEHVVPKNMMNQNQQLMMEVANNQLHQQIQQNATSINQLQQNSLQGMAIQQQQIQNQQIQQQQQQQQNNQNTVAQQVQQQQIQHQMLHQQQQQLQGQPNPPLQYPISDSPGQYYVNPLFQQYPQYQVYTSFFGEQIRTKQSELDEQLRRTTQQLDNKLIENLELQQIWTGHQQEEEYQEQQNKEEKKEIESQQVESQQQLVQQHSFKESKERIELFKKLQNQLNKLKSELFQQNEQQTNAKLSPFRLDPSKNLEKILNLMTIINEVDSHTNLAELKNEYEKTKSTLDKCRGERQKFFGELSQVTIQYHELENNYQKLISENKQIREQQMKEREQLELIIKTTHEKLRELTENNEKQSVRILDLQTQLELECKKRRDPVVVNHQQPQQSPDHEKIKHIKHEYGRKITDYQIEINDLKDYIKRRSQEDQQKRLDEKRYYEIELTKQKEAFDTLKKSSEVYLKDRETEIRILKENILSFDPDFFIKNMIVGAEKLRECPDCKKRDAKLSDYESRIKDLTDYIKSSTDRLSVEKKKHDEEIIQLNKQNQELLNSLFQKQTLLKNLSDQKQEVNPFKLHPSEPKRVIQVSYALSVTYELLTKLEVVLDMISSNEEYGSNMSYDYRLQLNQMKQSLLHKAQLKKQARQQSKMSHLDQIKEEIEDDMINETMSSNFSSQTQMSSSNMKDCVNELIFYLRKEVEKECEANNFQESIKQREMDFFDKVSLEAEINDQYKEIVKEGRMDRKLCHQVIVEVEKLMYKMNSLLITEQLSLEQMKSQDQLKMLTMSFNQFDSRLEYNEKYRELFNKILEAYLELPHKLKPIFDRNKKFETTISKFFKADSSLIYDLTAEVINQYKTKNDITCGQMSILESKYNDTMQSIKKQKDENEQYKGKIIQLNEKIVQINSAYNALQKHFYSGKNEPKSNASQIEQTRKQQESSRVQGLTPEMLQMLASINEEKQRMLIQQQIDLKRQ